VPKKDLKRVYAEQLFANEVMLLPYYIAALNVEHSYYELTGEYEPFEGLCFVDSLDLAEKKQQVLGFMTEKNTERVERQKATPITVIVGNPPYNVGQLNENDNNKNREYEIVEQKIKSTYVKDSAAGLKTQVYDPYVKFIRWATDRIGNRDGILCMITNNSFVDQIAFDGMRKHLAKDYSLIYHMHLEGNVRHNPTLSGTRYNVFGIQVGVGITIAIRSTARRSNELFFSRVDKLLPREQKLSWLAKQKSASNTKWTKLKPDEKSNWLRSQHADEFETYVPLGSRSADHDDAIFHAFSAGFKTNRDDVVYDFGKPALEGRMKKFVDDYNLEVDRFKRTRKDISVDDFVNYELIKWDGTLKNHLSDGIYSKFASKRIEACLYRPFARRWLYHDRLFINSVYQQRFLYPNYNSREENKAIAATDRGSEKPFMALASNGFCDLHLVGAGAA
jgi:predicted helicase